MTGNVNRSPGTSRTGFRWNPEVWQDLNSLPIVHGVLLPFSLTPERLDSAAMTLPDTPRRLEPATLPRDIR